MNTLRFLHEIFAVTVGGLYRLYRDDTGIVSMRKIANRSHNKAAVSEHIFSDQYFAITVRGGIIPYHHREWPAPNLPKIDVFSTKAILEQGHTSPVVGLFLHESEARICLLSQSTNIENPNWKECTKAVIAALKDDPVIMVSSTVHIGFPPDFFP